MKNRKKEKIMNCIKNMLHRENIFYIGPKFFGDYGRLDELTYKELKYILGNTKEIIQSDLVAIVDKKARLIAENVYDNGNGNVFFINISDGTLWTRYFNKEDSKIILNYYKRAGRKEYIEIKEDLINIVNEEKIKRFFNKYVCRKEIQIDDKKYTFNKYKEFRKMFSITPGFGRSWAVKAGYQEAIISMHTLTYYQWIEIDF